MKELLKEKKVTGVSKVRKCFNQNRTGWVALLWDCSKAFVDHHKTIWALKVAAR